MKTIDLEFIAAVARIYSEAVGKGLDLPLYLVAVGANGDALAAREIANRKAGVVARLFVTAKVERESWRG